MRIRPAHMIDFYKSGHIKQYPEGTEVIYGNMTARSAERANVDRATYDNKTVWLGIQGFAQWYLIDMWNDNFFNQPKDFVVGEYRERMDKALGPGAVSTAHIEALHDLGYLPIEIKALPEGSRVNIKVAYFTYKNTHPDFEWLGQYMEDVLSNELWKITTGASTSYEYWKVLMEFAEKTGAPKDFIRWQGHDFAFRGMGGIHDGTMHQPGHLSCFMGTDTVSAIDYIEDYYGGKNTFVGGSVPATEHSVMSAGGKDSELDTFRRLITDVYPNGIVSIVSDTWDLWHVLTDTMVKLKPEVLARGPDAFGNSKVVIRPDSGDPVKILTGYRVYPLECDTLADIPENIFADGYEAVRVKKTKIGLGSKSAPNKIFEVIGPKSLGKVLSEAEVKGAYECLYDTYGGFNVIGTQGTFKMLSSRVGLIYGDAITIARMREILQRLLDKGFASSIVYGIGSFAYQYVTRDSYGIALKATYARIKGVDHELFKDPITDDGTKKSAKGLIRIEKEGDDFVQYDQQTWAQEGQGELRRVFYNSKLYNFEDWATIRNRLGCLVS